MKPFSVASIYSKLLDVLFGSMLLLSVIVTGVSVFAGMDEGLRLIVHDAKAGNAVTKKKDKKISAGFILNMGERTDAKREKQILKKCGNRFFKNILCFPAHC